MGRNSISGKKVKQIKQVKQVKQVKQMVTDKDRKIAVIGAGASGLVAAYYASANPMNTVVIFEKNDIAGKKLRLTGNGRCNFSNGDLSLSHYEHFSYKEEETFCNSMILEDDLKLISSILDRFGRESFEAFLKECGILTFEKNGYYYPKSERAGELADIIVKRVLQKGAVIRYKTAVNEVIPEENGGFIINGEHFDKVICACGGKAAPASGSDGAGYKIARAMGHYVRFTYPVLVPLMISDRFKEISGVRVKGTVHGFINGKGYGTADGEIQFTDFFISGIPVFQVSRHLTKAVEEHQKVEVSIDFLPEIPNEEISGFLSERKEFLGDIPFEEFFEGMLPKKLYDFILKEFAAYMTMEDQNDKSREYRFVEFIKDYRIDILDHGGFNNAQCTKGGVVLTELTDCLESKMMPGLYIIGEMTDVDGECGGYNLQWAYSSGRTVGELLCDDE